MMMQENYFSRFS